MYNYFQASIENGGGMVVYNYGKWRTLASDRISEDPKHITMYCGVCIVVYNYVLWCITMYNYVLWCITMYNYFQASIENGGGMVVYNYGKWTTLASDRISEVPKHIKDLACQILK